MNTKTRLKAFYESEILKRDQDAGKRMGKTQRRILQFVGTHSRVLDVGCGSGYNAELVQDAGNYVIGVEISSHNVKVTHERGIEVCQHDLSEPLPFADDTFDKALFIGVAEHLFAPKFALYEIYRCLEPGGAILISVPNTVVWFRRVLFMCGIASFVESLKGDLRPWNHPHLRFFTRKTLEEMVKQCGFSVQEVFGNTADFPGALYHYARFPINKGIALSQKITRGLNFMADIWPSLCSRGLWLIATKPTSVS